MRNFLQQIHPRNIKETRYFLTFFIPYFLAFLFLLTEWYVFAYSVNISYPNLFGTFLKGIGDIAVLLVVYFFLNKNWRWVIVGIVWIISFFLFINCLYFRFWQDLIPTSIFATTANFDSNLFDYASNLFRTSDLVFIILPILYLGIFLFFKPYKAPSLSYKLKIPATAISILMFLAAQLSYLKSTWQYMHETEGFSGIQYFNNHYFGDTANYNSSYARRGLPLYVISYLTELFKLKFSHKNLTENEKKEIAAFLDELTDSRVKLLSTNPEDKNVIFIIAESLNADVIGLKIGDFKVTPTLDSLIDNDGTVFFDRVVSQIKSGGSSDGQMILLTGLLPLNYGAAAVSFPSNSYPALPKLLKNYHSEAFIADDGVAWNQKGSLTNYGFKKVHTIEDFKSQAISIGKDGALFKYFSQIKKTLPQPYFAVLITMSMHIPFNEAVIKCPEPIESLEGINQTDKDYLKAVHYFDTSLKHLLNSLPEDVIVIIASDHSQNIVKLSSDPLGTYIALGTDTTLYVNRIVGQANLFPVTLDILGIRDGNYSGIAPSALNNNINMAMDGFSQTYGNMTSSRKDSLLKEYKISDLIIRGDYFKFYPSHP